MSGTTNSNTIEFGFSALITVKEARTILLAMGHSTDLEYNNLANE